MARERRELADVACAVSMALDEVEGCCPLLGEVSVLPVIYRCIVDAGVDEEIYLPSRQLSEWLELQIYRIWGDDLDT